MFSFFFSEEYHWLFRLFVVFLVFLFVQLLFVLTFKILKHRSQDEKWFLSIVKMLYPPVKLIIWIFLIFFTSLLTTKKFQLNSLEKFIYIGRNIALIIGGTWMILRWKKYLQEKALVKEHKIDKHYIEFIGKIATIAIIFISFLLVLQKLGINVMPLVAFGSIGAASIGFAAKNALENFLGGLMLYITKPFVKGDFIEITSSEIEGFVENIGWYNTSIRELEKHPVYIPNNVFATTIIKNKTRRTHRYLDQIIKVRYEDFKDINIVTKQIEKMLLENKYVDSKQPSYVNVFDLGEYAVDILVRSYTIIKDLKEFIAWKEEILVNIKNILDENKVQIAIPTQQIKFSKEFSN